MPSHDGIKPLSVHEVLLVKEETEKDGEGRRERKKLFRRSSWRESPRGPKAQESNGSGLN